MKDKVPHGTFAGDPPGGRALRVPLNRFTQPTRLIVQRLLLEGQRPTVDTALLRTMLEERMTGIYGVTAEQASRAREEISRRGGDRSAEFIPLGDFSEPTQRVILLFAADRGGSPLAPDWVPAGALERCLDRDMTVLSGVGGGKAVRARREIREVLQEVLGRDIPDRAPVEDSISVRSASRAAGPLLGGRRSAVERRDPLRSAESHVLRSLGGLGILEQVVGDLAAHLRRVGNGPVAEAERELEREALGQVWEILDRTMGSLRSVETRLRQQPRDLDGGLRMVAELSVCSRLLEDARHRLSAVSAELGVRSGTRPSDSAASFTTAGRGDALHSAYLLTEDSNSFLNRVWQARSLVEGLQKQLRHLALHDPAETTSPAPQSLSADDRLIESPDFRSAVVRGEKWRRLVEVEGLDPGIFEGDHARALRDLEIARRRRDGETLAGIGDSYGMSRERIRQIIRDVVTALPFELRQEVLDAGRARRRTEESALRERLVDEVIGSPKPALPDLARRLGIEPGYAWSLLGPETRKFVRSLEGKERAPQIEQWSEEAMKEALVEASLYVAPFSGAGYDEALAQGLVEGPSRSSIINRFGTWNDACIAAGITPNSSPRDDYERRWSEDEMVDQVARFLVSDAQGSSLALFEAWRLGRIAEGEEIPSTSLLRLRAGGWAAVVERAWDRLVGRGWLAPLPEVQERLRAEARGGHP